MDFPHPLDDVGIPRQGIEVRRCGQSLWNGAGREVEARNRAAEARTRAARRPEQISVPPLVSPDQLAACGHDVDGDDLLRGITPATEAYAHPALEQKATEAEGGTVTDGEEAVVPRKIGVQLSARNERRDADDVRALVEGGLLEAAKIDHQRIVSQAPGRKAVTARANRHLPPAFPREPNTLDDVVLGFGDQHRGREALGMTTIEDASEARLVVSVGPAKDQAIIHH